MMLVTIKALKALGGSATIQELDEKVIDLEGVTEAEQAFMMPRGQGQSRTRVTYYLAWARTYLKRGNALENSSRGVWTLTESGAAIDGLDETGAIYEQVTQEERERVRAKRKVTKTVKPDIVDPTDEHPEEDWKSSLLAVLGAMPPNAFERLSQRLLREAGFTKVEVRGKSGDGGIDGVGVLRVNLVSFQIYFQCKSVGRGASVPRISGISAGRCRGRADKGLFITTGTFTSQASDEATRDGVIAIDLIDGDRLCDLLKENCLGVETEMIERVRIRSDWFEGI